MTDQAQSEYSMFISTRFGDMMSVEHDDIAKSLAVYGEWRFNQVAGSSLNGVGNVEF